MNLCKEIVQIDIEDTCAPLKTVGQYHKYTVLGQIGVGNNCKIYDARDESDKNRIVVVKILNRHFSLQIMHECTLYLTMHPKKTFDPNIRVPRVYYCAEERGFSVMVVDKFGPSLDKILRPWRGRFPLKTVLYFAEQMISILQFVHGKRIIHRDLKPSNFCLGIGDLWDQVYLNDFGQARTYLYQENHHIHFRYANDFVGNHLYSSINAHKRIYETRRDDLQALAYLLIDLANGTLPWKKAVATPGTHEITIIQMKQKTPISQICKGLPDSFGIFLKAARNLEYAEAPNYEFYKNLFRLTFKLLNFSNDNIEIFKTK